MERSAHGSGAGSAGVTPRALQGLTERARTDCACATGWRERVVGGGRMRVRMRGRPRRLLFCGSRLLELNLLKRFPPPHPQPWAAAGQVGVCPVNSAPSHSSVGSTKPAATVEFLRCHCRPTSIQAERHSLAYTDALSAPRWKWAAALQEGAVQPRSEVLL